MALIKCKECGKMISEEAGACPQCGKPVELPPPPPPPAPEPPPSSKTPLVIAVIIVLLAVGGSIFFVLRNDAGSREKVKNIIQKNVVDKVVEKKEPRIVFDKDVQIKEDTYHHIPLNLVAESEVTLEYTHTSGPMIDVMVLNEENFKRWAAEDREKITGISSLASSGKIGDVLMETLPLGAYYVILDNTNFGPTAPPTNLRTDVSEVHAKVTVQEH